MCKETVNFAYEEESNTFRQYLCILVRIDSALREDDPEQHWTNNYNYENNESILTNKQKAIEQTWQNWMMNHLKKKKKGIYINISTLLLVHYSVHIIPLQWLILHWVNKAVVDRHTLIQVKITSHFK